MEAIKKRSYPSAAQKARLIALLEADEELRSGKFSTSFTKKEGEKRWATIAEELNGIPGAKREWKEWRKTWQDMKTTAKKKSTAVRFSATSTGGGPAAPPLSEENIAVLRSISTNALIGHKDCYESVVEFKGLPSYSGVADRVSSKIQDDLKSSSTTALDKALYEDHSYTINPADATAARMSQHEGLPTCSRVADQIIVVDYEGLPTCSGMADKVIVLDDEDLPSTVPTMPMNESRTGEGRGVSDVTSSIQATKDDKVGSISDNKENRKCLQGKQRVPRRRAAVRRLEQSMAISESMQSLMREKMEMKKKFYERVLAELKSHSDMLNNIFSKLNNNNNAQL